MPNSGPTSAVLIVDFLNAGGAPPSDLPSWMSGVNRTIETSGLSLEDIVRSEELQQAIRDLIAVGPDTGASTFELLERSGRSGILRPVVDRNGTVRLEPVGGSPFAWLAGMILLAVHGAMADGTWSRVKLCRNPQCRRAFYDHSKNCSGVWCSMATCGSRAKARAYRRRRALSDERG